MQKIIRLRVPRPTQVEAFEPRTLSLYRSDVKALRSVCKIRGLGDLSKTLRRLVTEVKQQANLPDLYLGPEPGAGQGDAIVRRSLSLDNETVRELEAIRRLAGLRSRSQAARLAIRYGGSPAARIWWLRQTLAKEEAEFRAATPELASSGTAIIEGGSTC
ncbi:MAG: hypothetical protein AABX89_03915 [Candidatus Thermoplasmatota archaeon]